MKATISSVKALGGIVIEDRVTGISDINVLVDIRKVAVNSKYIRHYLEY